MRFLCDIGSDRRGAVVAAGAAAMTVLIGAAGLAVDVALWHANKRIVQSVADSAAVAGAVELHRGGTDPTAAAVDAATRNGHDASGASATLTVSQPPGTGAFAGAGDAVEAIYRRTVPTLFSRVFLAGPVAVSARAVATAGIIDACVWALNPSARSALKVSGNAQAAFDCGVMVNSDDTNALTVNGSACLNAASVRVVGDSNGGCVAPAPLTGSPRQTDPLSGFVAPAYGGCDHTQKIKAKAGATVTLSPGVYCNDIDAVSTGTLVFEPGVYVLDGARLHAGGQATVTGTGVAIHLTGNASNANNISFSGGASVALSAPTSGAMAGILFYQDPAAPAGIAHNFTGGATMALDGIVYLPKAELKFAGGAAADTGAALLIADTIVITGAAVVGSLAGSAAAANPALVVARLVE